MFEYLGDWVKTILIIVILLSFLEIIIPSGSSSKFVKFICGLIIISAVISPLTLLLL